MGTYAIGDVQGCYTELIDLLDRINFDQRNDRLWFTGDLVNRGPDSLATLRLVRQLGAVTVLGNHDLHLLAVASGKASLHRKDTLSSVLTASDRIELLTWLIKQPLLYRDQDLPYTMIHAGLPPQWDIPQACSLAAEVEHVLQGKKAGEYFSHMYGNKPEIWSDELRGWERLRFITNCFTRLRYCKPSGWVSMREKGPPGAQRNSLLPWYQIRNRRSADAKIIFGHWATVRLGEKQDFNAARVHALDTGCVWGGELTALRLEDEIYFSVPSRQPKTAGE
jgi:bis(5'-nucleosyl)-tetraphosphatase (symmetrical)